MSGPGRFGGVVTAMATPFDDDGALDLDGAARLARWLVEHGNDGLVVAGTTGEAPALSDDEKRDLWRAVAEAVTVPVIAGAGTNDTRHSVAMTRAAAEAGVAGILAVCPYYSRPSQAGIDAHLRAVAAATDLPVLVYDIPVRTGRKISNEVLVRLHREVPNVVGVKDAASDPWSTAQLLAAAPGLELYSGEDRLTLPLLSVGACGTVGVATHWTGRLHQRLFDAFWKGHLDEAREINARMLPSFAFESTDDAPNPMPTKAMLRHLGLPAGECRLPLGSAPEGLDDAAAAVLEPLGDDL
ncbi:MAG: 4-hydroxy-tetrahydrodipicolinate synthase [Acidimicrobiia bacterium]